MVKLHRYWRLDVGDHFYTNNPNGIGTTTPGKKGKYGYAYEGVTCYLYTDQVEASVPLYRYWKGTVSDHFYTTDETEIGTTTPGEIGNFGYKFESIVGYCFPSEERDTVPLYRYWNPKNSDHFYTTNGMEEIGTVTEGESGNHGYISEGVVCYVHM